MGLLYLLCGQASATDIFRNQLAEEMYLLDIKCNTVNVDSNKFYNGKIIQSATNLKLYFREGEMGDEGEEGGVLVKREAASPQSPETSPGTSTVS